MKKHIKGFVILFGAMLLLAGCTNQPINQDTQNETLSGENEQEANLEEAPLSVKYQSVFMEDGLLDIKCLPVKEAVYIAGVRQGADGFSAETVVYKWEDATEAPRECAVYEQEKLLSWCSDAAGKVAMIGMKVDTNTQEKTFYLHLLDAKGTKVGDYSLQNIFAQEKNFGSIAGMAWEGSEVCVADVTSRRVYILNYEEDCLKQSYEMEVVPDCLGYAQGTFYGVERAGNVYAFGSDTGAKQELGSNVFAGMSYLYSRTDGETVWAVTKEGLYAVELQSGNSEKIVDYLEYDILLQDSAVLYEESTSNIWKLVTWGQTGQQVEVFSLEPVKEGEVQTEKEIITLSIFFVDAQLQEAVVAFNKSNDKYRIEIISGEEGGNTQEFYDREQLELTTNKGPDIFTKTGNMQFVNYIDKGIVEDLTPYIERDLEVDDYLESSLYAYAKEGKVYAIEPYFIINCLVSTKEVVGDTENWTFEEMAAIMQEHPEITSFSEWADSAEVLRLGVGLGGISPTNYEAVRECILFAEQYGKTLAAGEQAMPGENVLVKEVQLNDALDWADIQAQYGPDIVPMGYPRDSRRGIRHSSQGWSINVNSDCKEGAWEFLKFLLSENYQRQMEGGFSPLKEVYEEQLESYASPLTYDLYLPEAGGVVTIKNSYNLPDSGVEIECMTEEQITMVRELVEESDSIAFEMDFDAWVIIQEEAAAYFSGQRSIDDVMLNIENRINLYMDEKGK